MYALTQNQAWYNVIYLKTDTYKPSPLIILHNLESGVGIKIDTIKPFISKIKHFRQGIYQIYMKRGILDIRIGSINMGSIPKLTCYDLCRNKLVYNKCWFASKLKSSAKPQLQLQQAGWVSLIFNASRHPHTHNPPGKVYLSASASVIV